MTVAGGTASVGVAVGRLHKAALEVAPLKRNGGHTKVSVQIGKTRPIIELHSPVMDKLAGFIETNRTLMPLPFKVCQQGEFAGQTVAICGPGPSLAQHEIEGVDQIWAINSALPYLLSRGVAVSAAVGIDQTPGLLREWASRPDVQYYIASSCDPDLVRHLMGMPLTGQVVEDRRIAWFHNYIGIPDEIPIYKKWPKPMFMVASGHTTVNRMIPLARYMGFGRIDIYGADCALGPDDVAHADGESAESAYRNPMILSGEVHGRTWRTRPDMLIGAVDLVRQVRIYNGTVRLIGDTLPVALLDMSDDFLDGVARMLKPGELPPTS